MMSDNDTEHAGYIYRYPRPAVTVDVVVFSLPDDTLHVLLIRRKHPPFEDMWAFPGGFVNMDEDLRTAALRELQEETGLISDSLLRDSSLHNLSLYVEQLHAFGAPDRDPRHRTISVAYLALAQWEAIAKQRIRAADDAADARWWPANDLPELAFDHAHIMRTARQRLSSQVDLRDYAVRLLPAEFTFNEYQTAYAAICGGVLDAARFQQQLAGGSIIETDHSRATADGETKLYRRGPRSGN